MFAAKLLATCALFYVCFAGEQDVLDLTDNDFHSQLARYDIALVMFYAPWCGHCKRLKPDFAKAAEDLLRNDPSVILVRVDCTDSGKDTCNKYGVSGYPTLKIFRNGEVTEEYKGPREAAGIVKYMKAQVGPSSRELQTVEDLENFLVAEKDVSIVGFFEGESDLKAAFFGVADKHRDKIRFGHSSNKEVLDKHGITDGILLFRPAHLHNKFEDDHIKYPGSGDDLLQWITKNYHGYVGHRRMDNSDDFKKPRLVAYYDVDYVKNPKGTNYWRNRIIKIAKDYSKTLTFAISSKDEFQHELNEHGIDYVKGDKPVILGRDTAGRKYVMEQEFNLENLKKFAHELNLGLLVPYIKSEPVPESNSEPVKVAVAKNFDLVVVNNDQDTLIEFYAPWCGHCKKLAPVLDELALKVASEDIAVVKMDATANDVPPEYEVRGFPTLYWLPKDRSTPIKYEGGREVEDFMKFIAKHATRELRHLDRKGNSKDKTDL